MNSVAEADFAAFYASVLKWNDLIAQTGHDPAYGTDEGVFTAGSILPFHLFETRQFAKDAGHGFSDNVGNFAAL